MQNAIEKRHIKKEEKNELLKDKFWGSLGSEHKEFCLCWGFTAQSTQWGHVERGQFT